MEAIGSGKYDMIVLNFANPEWSANRRFAGGDQSGGNRDAGLGRIAEAIGKLAGRCSSPPITAIAK